MTFEIGLSVEDRVAAFAVTHQTYRCPLRVVGGWRAHPPERLHFAIERSIADRRLPARSRHGPNVWFPVVTPETGLSSNPPRLCENVDLGSPVRELIEAA
jgi:hypothetical protein